MTVFDDFRAWAFDRVATPEQKHELYIAGMRRFAQELAHADPDRLFAGAGVTQWNPNPFVQTKGFATVDLMRRDDQIKAAMNFKKLAVLATDWEIQEPPDATPEEQEATAFIDFTLKEMRGTLKDSLTEMLSALDYGFSITEKIYAKQQAPEFGDRIGLAALKTRKPHHFSFEQDKFGNLVPNGIIQQTSEGLKRYPANKFILFTYQGEFSNPYGRTDFEAAYRAWWTKDNAYKWMAMWLEKFGIPPIFMLYDPKPYTVEQKNALKTVFKELQAGSTGMIPRPVNPQNEKSTPSDTMELWAPDFGGRAREVWEPILRMLNADMARALMMPGLLGMTPDEQQGSFARAKVHFDAFMLMNDHLRNATEDHINEDMVRELTDINYTVQNYPAFRFLPIADELRADLLEQWGKLVGIDVVRAQDEDEEHIRSLMGFPEMSEPREPLTKDPDPIPEPDPKDEEMPDEEDGPPRSASMALGREPNRFEQRVDFAAIGGKLRELENDAAEKIVPYIRALRDKLTRFVEKQFTGEIDQVSQIDDLVKLPRVGPALADMMKQAFEAGRVTVREELPRLDFADDPSRSASAAAKFMRSKRFWITGIIESNLLNEARNILFRAIDTGELPQDTTKALREAFEPYIGDPNVIRDGKVVTPFRLETILRTNATDVFNRGRLLEGSKVAEFLNGWEYSAILDERTTEVCRHLDGKVFRTADQAAVTLRPPRHFNCRSLLVPVTLDITVEEDEFVTRDDVGRGLELSGSGFGGPQRQARRA